MSDPSLVRFDPGSLVALNAIVALMMLGVSLTLRVEDFRRVLRRPAAPLAGLVAQFVLLPAGTCLATWLLRVPAPYALGMILVAACPGGAFSNIMTWRARGNVALSVSMTAVSSVVATVLTPANFALYGWLNPGTREYLRGIALPSDGILTLVALVLGLPLVLGMLAGSRWPRMAARSEGPLRAASLVVLLGFVAIAFAQNMELFLSRFHTFFWLVVGQNAMALALGAGLARALRLDEADRRAVALEVGIQNSGLGLVILFTFFPTAAEMMLITAFWGVWHLVSGLALSGWWARRAPVPV